MKLSSISSPKLNVFNGDSARQWLLKEHNNIDDKTCIWFPAFDQSKIVVEVDFNEDQLNDHKVHMKDSTTSGDAKLTFESVVHPKGEIWRFSFVHTTFWMIFSHG